MVRIGKSLMTICGGEAPHDMPTFCEKAQETLDLFKELSDYQMISEVHRMHMMTQWVGTGMPIFSLTQGLAASLVLSTYKNMTFADVPLPFPSFGVQLPSGWLKPPFDKLSYIWVNTFGCFKGPIGDFSLMGTPENRPGQVMDPIHAMRFDVFSRGSALIYHRLGDMDYDVEEWLKNKDCQKQACAEEQLDETEQSVMALCMRIATGLCMYIASTKLGPPDGAWKKGKARTLNPDKPRRWTLGREVKLPAHMRSAAADFTQSHRSKTKGAGDAWKLLRRFVVRGHFKRVRVGPKDDWSYKTSWIAPYWKGPEGGMLMQRNYSVDETTL